MKKEKKNSNSVIAGRLCARVSCVSPRERTHDVRHLSVYAMRLSPLGPPAAAAAAAVAVAAVAVAAVAANCHHCHL